MPNRLRRSGLLLLWLLLFTVPVNAQSSSWATLSQPDTQSFPIIQTFLDVHAADGSFIHGLQEQDLRLLEDDRPVAVSELSELSPGVQVVFAINPGDSFTIRNSQGLSRFDFIYNALKSWTDARQGSTVDDLSLIVTGGPVRSHTNDPAEIISALDGFQIDSVPLNPSLDTLSQALDVALDPTPRLGMERAILFITSPLTGDLASGVQDLITRAQQQQVRVYIWFIGSAELLETPASMQLQELASQTGGTLSSFVDIDQLPSPEAYLDKLRDIYLLKYETSSSTDGTRRLVIEIENGDEQIVTPALEYELILLPPDPAFISPVAEIAREVPEQGAVEFWEQAGADDLLPKEQQLQVLVDFPDGRSRPLMLTRLYVDGKVIAENDVPPFDRFTWDLSGYTTSARHILKVEAVDSLGFTGTSIEVPVQVTVDLPGASPLVLLIRKAPLAMGLVILFSAALSLLVLIVGGKIKPRPLRVPAGFRSGRRKQAGKKALQSADESQAVLQAEMDGRRFSGWVSRLHWPQRRLTQQAYAYLIPIPESDSSVPKTPITIDSNEITLGSDRNQAVLVFSDLSVEALHARLTRLDDEKFVLADQGSVSGTWLNYSPVTREGAPVQHGDIIHIGRVGFQFKLMKPRRTRKLAIIRIESFE